jgi:hypothetical protein
MLLAPDNKEHPMAMAKTLAVVPRRRRKAAKIRVQRRVFATRLRYLSELAALPDRGATVDDLPLEFFRFPPF